MADIVLTGLASNDPVPGVYIEVNFAQGPAAGSGSQREILLIGNKIAAGSATVDTQIYGPDTEDVLQTEGNAITLFGQGSELHLMWKEATKVNQDSTIRAIALAENGSSVAATGTVTFATNATGAGVARVYICDDFVEASIATGDTPTTIAAAIVAAVAAKPNLPVTASNAAGVVTLTAKNKGLRGNSHRYLAKILSNGVNIATTVTPTVDSAFTGGTLVDDMTNVLTTINPTRYYYIVSAGNDSTQLAALTAQVNTQQLPTTGIRQRIFAAFTGTLSAGNALSTGINGARDELQWQEQAPIGPSRLAAKCAAIYALEELAANPRTNFIGYGNDEATSRRWGVPGPRNVSARPSRTSIKSALLNGLTPIASNPNGSTYIVNRVTTRTLTGSTPDYRISRAHKVTICDFFADDLGAKTVLNFSGKRIGDDPRKGEKAPGPLVVTPQIYKGALFRLIDDYKELDLLQNVQDIKDGVVVERQQANRTRLGVRVPLQPCDNAEQFAIAVDQVA